MKFLDSLSSALMKSLAETRLSFFVRLKIIGRKNNNKVEGRVHVRESARIKFKGIGNKLKLGDNVTLKDVRITFSKDNAVMIVEDGCVLNGSFVGSSSLGVEFAP